MNNTYTEKAEIEEVKNKTNVSAITWVTEGMVCVMRSWKSKKSLFKNMSPAQLFSLLFN